MSKNSLKGDDRDLDAVHDTLAEIVKDRVKEVRDKEEDIESLDIETSWLAYHLNMKKSQLYRYYPHEYITKIKYPEACQRIKRGTIEIDIETFYEEYIED